MTHPIPASMDYLVGKLATELPDVQVLDGPPVVELGNKGVAIGWAVDRLAVEMDKQTEGLQSGGLGGGDGIRYDINCMTWVRTGDSDMKAIRDTCYEQLNAVEQFLQNDRRLGGIVTRASMRLVDYDQLQSQEDSWGTAAFVITCNAFTS
jgi:hypothetical protein